LLEVDEGASRPQGHYSASALAGLRASFSALQLAPPLAARLATWLFFHPRRKRPGTSELPDHRVAHCTVNAKRIQVYEFGQGPSVLFVHGWESSVHRMRLLVQRLAAAGFRVVTFDLPAHGASQGGETNPIEATQVIHELSRTHGPFQAAVAHSFGAVCLANALREGLEVERLVLFAAPANIRIIVDQYARFLKLRGTTRLRLYDSICRRFAPLSIDEELSIAGNLSRALVPTLLLHDLDDASIPFDEARTLRRAHPGVQLVATRGLSHNGIVRSARCLEQCVDFLKQSNL
jgi:pimeloyl-ACP methyl ester carboxylesterase